MANFNPTFLIELDEADFEKASKRADDLGLLSKNKSGRKAVLIGYLGELGFDKYMTSRGLKLRNEDTYDYDFSLTLDHRYKRTFEVKTRRARRRPQYGYVNTISGHNPLQKGDYYVFLRVVLDDSTKKSRVFFTGAKKTSLFRSQSRFVLGGTSVYGLKQDFDCYALRFQDCLSLSEFLSEFETDFISKNKKKETFNKKKRSLNEVSSSASVPSSLRPCLVDLFLS